MRSYFRLSWRRARLFFVRSIVEQRHLFLFVSLRKHCSCSSNATTYGFLRLNRNDIETWNNGKILTHLSNAHRFWSFKTDSRSPELVEGKLWSRGIVSRLLELSFAELRLRIKKLERMVEGQLPPIVRWFKLFPLAESVSERANTAKLLLKAVDWKSKQHFINFESFLIIVSVWISTLFAWCFFVPSRFIRKHKIAHRLVRTSCNKKFNYLCRGWWSCNRIWYLRLFLIFYIALRSKQRLRLSHVLPLHLE